MDGDFEGGESDAADRARVLIEMRRHEDALRVAGVGLASAPNDPELHCLSALALIRLDRDVEALVQAELAAAADPENEWAHRLRAIALVAESKRDKGPGRRKLALQAVEAATEAQRISPGTEFVYEVLADARSAAGDLRGADDAARQAVQMSPQSSSAWTIRSKVALVAKDYAVAEEAARTAIRLDHENYAAHNNLGAALIGQNHRQDAAAAFVEAGRLNPQAEVVHRNLFVTGTRLPRIILILLAIPLLLVPGIGMLLYIGLLVVGNLVIFRHPRFKRWATARSIKSGQRLRNDRTWDDAPAPAGATIADLRAIRPQPAVRTPLVLVLAGCAWFIAFIFVVTAIAPDQEAAGSRGLLIAMALTFIALGAYFTGVVVKRRRP
jgi:Flp pilus assembly protein TadD